MTLTLSDQKPFAKGGHRLCFVHPENDQHCIKVRRPDFTLEDLRKSKGFPKNLRPLKSFDDNLEEYRVIDDITRKIGAEAFQHIYHCYGFIDTDLGPGLECELIRDDSGLISLSLKQYIWEHGYTESCKQAVEALSNFWVRHQIPSRRLLIHNIMAQQSSDGDLKRLVVIDGLGSPNLVPWHWLSSPIKTQKVNERIRHLQDKIEEAVYKRSQGVMPSRVGFLDHRDDLTSFDGPLPSTREED
ncbi:YrbL family protein [Marinobacter sp.]|uniref:YrbL family protein n=1 Tax=Marinobacter sp. TaxID=50741 RepID=UPI003A926461